MARKLRLRELNYRFSGVKGFQSPRPNNLTASKKAVVSALENGGTRM